MLNDVLGVAIGVLFVYLVLSLICSVVAEVISRWLGTRARVLEEWIRRLFSEDGGAAGAHPLTEAIYRHPLISPLFPERGRLPACIPPRNFALALIDHLAPPSAPGSGRTLQNIRAQVGASPKCNEETRNVLLLLIDEAQDNLERAIRNIETWFDDPLGTAGAKYKREIGKWVLVLAIPVCAVFNLDTIMIADTLWKRPAIRESVAAAAESLTGQLEPTESGRITAKMDTLMLRLEESKIPVGWSRDSKDPRRIPEGVYGWLLKFVGIAATVLSTSLGAPFWFDFLRKILGMRAAMRPRAEQAGGDFEQGGGGPQG